jgi:hypothetical protein
MSWAERAYEYRTNGKRKQEDKEDIANRLVQRRNKLFERIGKINNHKELIELNKELKALEADGYTDKNDLTMLRKQMKEQVQDLKQTLATNREEIVKKQDSLKKERYSESIDTLTKVNAEADSILLQLLVKLSKDNVRNKVIVSDMMKRQDRATSIAIMKLSQMPVYEGLITPRMKENLLVLSKSDAEIKWQERQDNRVAEVGKELAEVTMKRFMLDKAEAIIFPKENVMFE